MNQIKDLERRKKIVSKLRMIDDIFFQKMFEDRAACEEILRVCMEDPVLEVLEVVPQKELKNLLTEFDVFNGGHTMYHVNKVVQETGEMIQDGQQEIYLNAKVDDGTIQAALMKNFMLEEVADERFPEVSRRFYE